MPMLVTRKRREPNPRTVSAGPEVAVLCTSESRNGIYIIDPLFFLTSIIIIIRALYAPPLWSDTRCSRFSCPRSDMLQMALLAPMKSPCLKLTEVYHMEILTTRITRSGRVDGRSSLQCYSIPRNAKNSTRAIAKSLYCQSLVITYI